MGKKYELAITLGGEVLDVVGYYTKGREGVWYTRNGDPGSPPEPETFEIQSVRIGKKDVTELFDTLFYAVPGMYSTTVSYVPVMDRIEDMCIEHIYYNLEGEEE